MSISRRDFLKLTHLAFGVLAFPVLPEWPTRPDPPVGRADPFPIEARVAIEAMYLYQEPDFRSERAGIVRRDQLLYICEELISPHGPGYNPRWYRLENGYAHSGYLQRVDGWHYNRPLPSLPEGGQIAEVTVPYTQAYRRNRRGEWSKLYRLYYGSVHGITGLEEGPDGTAWYVLTDDLLHVEYGVPARHLRPIPPEELSPISADVPPEEKRIEISVEAQTLTAYEGGQPVRQAPVSTGIKTQGPSPNGIPTDTPQGHFHVQVKVPHRHMGDGNLTSDINAYELPGVPWVCFFHVHGIALHGTYWHDNFGIKMSHGCVNLRTADAKWLYRWTDPVAEPGVWNTKGWGTLIHIF